MPTSLSAPAAAAAAPGAPRAARGPQAANNEATPLLRAQQRPAKDPLMAAANKKVSDHVENKRRKGLKEDDIGTADLAVRVIILAGAPSTLYIFTLLAVVLFYDDWPLWVFITFLLTVLKSFLVARFFRAKRWRRWLGILLGLATCTGFVSGLLAYYKDLVYYNYYKAAVVHANVAANEDVLRFAESGLITFTDDSRVDVSRSVGYQSAKKNAKLCVAPVVDSIMAATDPVTFFAIGTDCCDFRAGFRCGDASDPTAHGAALLLPLGQLASVTAAKIFEDAELIHGFVDALHLQQAAFSTVLGNHTRFLHWAKDPTAVQDKYRSSAITGLTVWSVFFILGLFTMASTLGAGQQNVRKLIRKGREHLDSEHPHDTEIRVAHARPGRRRAEDWFFQWL